MYLWVTPVCIQFALCKALLGFTVTLQSHCVPGCPPVSQWLGHSGPVCQLVDICLLPPPSVVMAAKPPTIATRPLPLPAGLLHPSLVFPPDTSCEPLMLILQSTSFSLVISQPAQHSFWNSHCTLLFDLSSMHTETGWRKVCPFRFIKKQIRYGEFCIWLNGGGIIKCSREYKHFIFLLYCRKWAPDTM